MKWRNIFKLLAASISCPQIIDEFLLKIDKLAGWEAFLRDRATQRKETHCPYPNAVSVLACCRKAGDDRILVPMDHLMLYKSACI